MQSVIFGVRYFLNTLQPTFKYRVPIHIAGWAIFFVIPLLLSPIHEFAQALREPSNLVSMLIRNLLWMGLFYLNLLYLTPVLLKDKRVGIFLAAIVAVIISVSLINSKIHHLFSQFLDPDFQRTPPPRHEFGPGRPPTRPLDFGPPGPFFSNFLITVMIASVSTSAVLWSDWVKARADEQERAFQKVASELAVLKLQISPHFLFNTLNNIRWLVRSKSDQAEPAIVKLSQLLRYILYHTQPETVPLDKEVEHIKDYVSLQQMRLTNDQSLSFTYSGSLQGKKIVPLLFIPIIENVFKHGEFTDAFKNEIQLVVEDDRVLFKTINLISQNVEEKDERESGIGLANVKKRLALHYPAKHILTFSKDNGIFKLKLEIILDRSQET